MNKFMVVPRVESTGRCDILSGRVSDGLNIFPPTLRLVDDGAHVRTE